MHLVDAEVGGALLLHLPLHVHLDQAGGSDLVVHHPWEKNTVNKNVILIQRFLDTKKKSFQF